ncbi:MAG: hypothetical protein AAB690_01880 [Patescibacteria group bacterium]
MKSISFIFGGEAKVKIMRLFTFNPNLSFPLAEIAYRVKERSNVARREINNLVKAGFIKKRGKNYTVNSTYIFRPAIENFLVDAAPLSDKEIIKRLSRAGSMKLILLSGVFLHDKDARVDVLVVGDHIKQSIVETVISYIESQLGKEVRYAIFDTPDFQYRLGIYDKLIRDILDYPHRKVLNKLGI